MFRLTKAEVGNWISQIVISNREKMGMRRPPYVFTEHGILMLSSVLRSERAVDVNIRIMREFVKLRLMIAGSAELVSRLKILEMRMDEKDEEVKAVFDAVRQLMALPEEPARTIGFHHE
jgi:hypothetical protein